MLTMNICLSLVLLMRALDIENGGRRYCKMRRLSTPYPLARLVSAKASIAPLSYRYSGETDPLMSIMPPPEA